MDTVTLDRFLKAQERTYQIALAEIKRGEKCSHWMWYIFPQLRGLGLSPVSYAYGIDGLEEARAYLDHPVLSARLYEICGALLTHKGKSAYAIFGGIDEMKLKSSMTLFSLLNERGSIFHQILDAFFDGQLDDETLRMLKL